MSEPFVIAKSGSAELCFLPAMANCHGLITGATSCGKTMTLQTLEIGVPVFMADVKSRPTDHSWRIGIVIG